VNNISYNVRSRGAPRDLILDADGVLFDYLSGIRDFASQRLGRKIVGFPTDFDLTEWFGFNSPDQTREMISTFNQGAGGGFGRLNPLPYAKEVLEAVREQGRNIHIITAVEPLPKVIELRRENLFNAFGDIFTDIHMVGLHQSKAHLLQQYHQGTWVEDKFENAIIGQQAGHKSCLMKASINTKYKDSCDGENIIWIDGWRDLAKVEGVDLSASHAA